MHSISVVLLFSAVLSGCGDKKNDSASKMSGPLSATSGSSIVNGTVVQSGEEVTKTVVSLGLKMQDGSFKYFCTGTLIDKNIVLTAAHCSTSLPDYANKAEVVVMFGLSETDKNMVMNPITAFLFHENYMSKEDQTNQIGNNDLALIKFVGDIPATHSPAKILSERAKMSNSQEVIVAGYGATSGVSQGGGGTLRMTSVKVKDAAFMKREIVTDETKTGSCNGDSGGPLYLKTDDGLQLAGVTSRGDRFCRVQGIYTVVADYLDWIAVRTPDLM